ncbi:MAG: right-handed parallel beta-helix repeat-containing protein [Acidobacteria bacterium]|nr:MAG: right-handed parallel beta-helix repeat-containing protein [Acidobacteriota bacterium]GIK78206.1 MAG: hypothetical protein BroJett022_18960 [Actinomycetes bacterium]
MGRRPQRLLPVALAAAVLGAAAAPEATAAPTGDAALGCDRTLAAGGDVVAFVAGLGPGEVGCLREGIHVAAGVARIGAPGVLLSSYPGESATLSGRLWIDAGGDRAVVQDLILDGRNPEAKPSPTINADDVVLRGNEISNEHTAICVSVNDYGGEPPPRRVVIEGNVIHDCGLLPATNHHHGIYLAGARGALVSGNLIYGNADRGIQLYPDADGSVVVGNVIDGNGSGLIFGGDGSSSSDRNLVAGNIITGSGDRFNIESHWQGPIGEGNVAIGNCLATTADEYGGSPPGSGLEPSMQGVLTFGNAVARPGYEAPTVDAAALVGAFPCGAGGAARG